MKNTIPDRDVLNEQQAFIVLDLLMDTDLLLNGVAEDIGYVVVDDDLDDNPFPDCDDESQEVGNYE